MSTDLSPENQRFLDEAVAAGVYRSRGEALDEAIALLKRRQELLAKIDAGLQQLENGQYTDYDSEGLRQRFDEIQAEGRRKYEASRKQL